MMAIDAKAFDAGAPSRAAQMWDHAKWSHIEAEVKRLQLRIAKAVRDGRWGKVKALQRLLTRSHSGKMLAVNRVTENRGKRTPGVDGRIWSSPAARWKAMLSRRHRGYRLDLLPEGRKLARHEVSAGTGFHDYRATMKVTEEFDQLLPRYLFANTALPDLSCPCR